MLLQGIEDIVDIEWVHTLADVIGIVFGFLQPYLTPIGQFMVYWVDYLMQFFPLGNLTLYLVIFVILIISGGVINCKWTGDTYIYKKEKKKLKKMEPTVGDVDEGFIDRMALEESKEAEKEAVIKCKECGLTIGTAAVCPYCGAIAKKEDIEEKVDVKEEKIADGMEKKQKKEKKKKEKSKKKEEKDAKKVDKAPAKKKKAKAKNEKDEIKEDKIDVKKVKDEIKEDKVDAKEEKITDDIDKKDEAKEKKKENSDEIKK
ncbi:MAG: hypothetical protein ACTSUT_09845 [Promethearchaeota archaeon]